MKASVPNLTDAPGFRSINQLARGRSGVQGVLAAANEIHGQAAEVAKLRADSVHDGLALECLRDERDELETRLQELSAENASLRADADDVAETVAHLHEINMQLVNQVAVLQSKLNTARAQVSAAKP